MFSQVQVYFPRCKFFSHVQVFSPGASASAAWILLKRCRSRARWPALGARIIRIIVIENHNCILNISSYFLRCKEGLVLALDPTDPGDLEFRMWLSKKPESKRRVKLSETEWACGDCGIIKSGDSISKLNDYFYAAIMWEASCKLSKSDKRTNSVQGGEEWLPGLGGPADEGDQDVPPSALHSHSYQVVWYEQMLQKDEMMTKKILESESLNSSIFVRIRLNTAFLQLGFR